MKESTKIKIAIVIVIWICLAFYREYFMVFDTNKMAISQLESSDSNYAEWQAWKTIVKYYWVFYLLPLLILIPDVVKKFK